MKEISKTYHCTVYSRLFEGKSSALQLIHSRRIGSNHIINTKKQFFTKANLQFILICT